MMSIADLDGDGKMRLSEFCKLMEQLVPIINERPRRKVESLSLGMTSQIHWKCQWPWWWKNHFLGDLIFTDVNELCCCFLMVTFVPKLTMPILPNQTPGGVRDLWSRVGFQPMSYTTHYPWYPSPPPYFRLRSAKKVVSSRNSQVDHIAIVVSDVGRSSAFYGGTLGMVQVLF